MCLMHCVAQQHSEVLPAGAADRVVSACRMGAAGKVRQDGCCRVGAALRVPGGRCRVGAAARRCR
eukprot:7637112-Alexandrium_andersonii.AAC.1